MVSPLLFLSLLLGYTLAQTNTQVLLSLYNATNGVSWENNTNWMVGDPCDGWYGITCDNSSSIVAIDLSANNLDGTLPNSLGQLLSLRRLYLDENYALAGTIPVLTNLTKLSELYLDSTAITGAPPAWLSTFANLTVISLTNTSLKGSIPTSWCSLTQVHQLSISGEGIIGTIPSCIGSMSSLVYLSIVGTGIVGQIPESITQLYNLVILELNFNNLTGTIPTNIGHLVKLEKLVLYNNQLTGVLPSSLGKLTSLAEMHLRNNYFDQPLPTELQNLQNLITLGLSSNYLNGSIPDWLSPIVMPTLEVVDLKCNKFVGPLPDWLQTNPAEQNNENVWFGCNNIPDDELPAWCTSLAQCGSNSCDGTRCMVLSPDSSPNKAVMIVLFSFLAFLFVGNLILVSIIIRRKCRRNHRAPELKPLVH